MTALPDILETMVFSGPKAIAPQWDNFVQRYTKNEKGYLYKDIWLLNELLRDDLPLSQFVKKHAKTKADYRLVKTSLEKVCHAASYYRGEGNEKYCLSNYVVSQLIKKWGAVLEKIDRSSVTRNVVLGKEEADMQADVRHRLLSENDSGLLHCALRSACSSSYDIAVSRQKNIYDEKYHDRIDELAAKKWAGAIFSFDCKIAEACQKKHPAPSGKYLHPNKTIREANLLGQRFHDYLLAAILGLNAQRILPYEDRHQLGDSLDAAVHFDSTETAYNKIADNMAHQREGAVAQDRMDLAGSLFELAQDHLPAAQVKLLQQRYMHGMGCPQIGKLEGVGREAIRLREIKALAALRQVLENVNEPDSATTHPNSNGHSRSWTDSETQKRGKQRQGAATLPGISSL